MSAFAKEILPVNIEEEMKQSYMEYAMSVIVGRALPDVRDGMKPVHRRVLFAMRELSNDWNKPYKKSARIVGDVIGKYHPHGDSAVYDTIVRMAQPFSLRYMLVDGQGNFGSVDGDAPAAMRYTEVRMSRIAHELLADLDKETVDFTANYDESLFEPVVFPARVPNLLVNGSSGIAVGLASNIPPHNLTEVINGCLAVIDDPDIELPRLIEIIPGPDFPTAGIINGARGIYEGYATGRGRVHVRARTHIEGGDDRQAIIVTELPYQVNKATLIEKIADLVRDKKLEGIRDLRDESDKDGMRIFIELKRNENPDVVLNNLYQFTSMQTVFGMNMVALVDGQPRLLALKQMLEAFIRHRREVVMRRTQFDLRKARERAHVLEGLAVALANIDPIIDLIKKAPSPPEAKIQLIARLWEPGAVVHMLERVGADSSRPETLAAEFGLVNGQYRLSEAQAQAILEMRLQRLTGLEQEKIVDEFKALLDDIQSLLTILRNPGRLMEVIREELIAIRDQFGDKRRTEIVASHQDLEMEDLITPEDMVVTLSHTGYVKSQPVSMYQAQRRGGKGKAATTMKDEDFIEKLFIANTHDTILCFSSAGQVYWLKVYKLPQASRIAKGKPFVNLLPLDGNERITAVLPIKEYAENQFVFMVTSHGTVKKTSLSEFSRPRTSGIIAVELSDGDQLVDVALTDGTKDVILFSDAGKAMRFNEETVRAMGRTAHGVIGMRMDDDDRVIALIIVGEGDVLTATERGYGKRTAIDDYPLKGRGGLGVISIQTSERNGKVVSARQVTAEDEVMLISNGGTLVRTRASEISQTGRNTQGVKLISLSDGEKLVGVERVAEQEGGDEAEAATSEPAPV